eukprot:934471-Amphidinium_carterae.1
MSTDVVLPLQDRLIPLPTQVVPKAVQSRLSALPSLKHDPAVQAEASLATVPVWHSNSMSPERPLWISEQGTVHAS